MNPVADGRLQPRPATLVARMIEGRARVAEQRVQAYLLMQTDERPKGGLGFTEEDIRRLRSWQVAFR
jgi:hypothetical protein